MGATFSTDAEFEAFYERHWKYVYRLCYTYMKSAADAEDCTEDVFVKVLTNEYEFTDELYERKWLTVTAINLCKDRLKSWKHRAVDNTIRKSIDKIEPAEGARERMLQNIKQKAAEQTAQETAKPKAVSFNRIMNWALPAAACLVIAAVGIRVIPDMVKTPDESGNVLIGNPFSEEMTIEELREQLDISVKIPEDAKDAACFIIDGSIANIDFSRGGKSYTLRASKQSGDFFGVNGTLIKSDKIDAANDAALETIRGLEYDYFKLTWTDGVTTYILTNNTEISAEDITEIYDIIK